MTKNLIFPGFLLIMFSSLATFVYADSYAIGSVCANKGDVHLAADGGEVVACLENENGSGTSWQRMSDMSPRVKVEVSRLNIGAGETSVWRIAGLKIGVPVVITLGAAYQGVIISTKSGSNDFLHSQISAGDGYALRPSHISSRSYRPNIDTYQAVELPGSLTLIPTSDILEMYVDGVGDFLDYSADPNNLLYAYQ